jgi:hypothetical protein
MIIWESGSTCFGAEMVPCLWRADPSFMNSVTGSGNVAKYSNILQDITIDINSYDFKKFCEIQPWPYIANPRVG